MTPRELSATVLMRIIRMKIKLLITVTILIMAFTANAYVIQGSSTKPVMNGNIVVADSEAREQAILNALKNYFNKLKANQPDKEIPDVTIEFFKFIKSYKIAERAFTDDTVTYTILADVDDVALNDLMYFVDNVVNTAVYNIEGIGVETGLSNNISGAFKEYKFDTKHQSDYQANLKENSTPEERTEAFKNSDSQYFLEMSLIREPSAEGQCTIILTTKTYSKTKEFKTLKTRSSSEDIDDDQCVLSAFSLSFLKTLGFIRKNFIPLPSGEKVLSTYNLVAENYDNFATPKKIMEDLKKRAFIDSYKIKSFAGNKLDIEISAYLSSEILIKKLQSIEAEYGFSSRVDESNNILLDFTE